MELPSRLIEAAVDQMASLPGIGRKTALRLVLNLLRRSDDQVNSFSESFQLMRQGVRGCSTCHNLTEEQECSICVNPLRKEHVICVVEDLRDLLAIEATGQFQGRYHVLGGVISPMEGVGPNDLNIESLLQGQRQSLRRKRERSSLHFLPRWKVKRRLFICSVN